MGVRLGINDAPYERPISPVQFEHHVRPAADEAPLDYDDDPNNWTARMYPSGSFSRGALKPSRRV